MMILTCNACADRACEVTQDGEVLSPSCPLGLKAEWKTC